MSEMSMIEGFSLGIFERYFKWKIGSDGNEEAFEKVGEILSKTFPKENFSPLQLAAGILLLYEDAAACKPKPDGSGDQTDNGTTPEEEDTAPRVDLHRDDPDAPKMWNSILRVQRAMEFAGAAYGIQWIFMRNYTFKNFFNKLLPKRWSRWNHNKAAIQMSLPKVKEEHIWHIGFSNDPMETPFFVAVDPIYKVVVISIRGTASEADVVTDVDAEPVAFSDGEGYYAHQGMNTAARYVFDELTKHEILQKYADKFESDHSLIITGHSLGAGTAVLLGFLLRGDFPQLRVLAFSPPGCLLNEAARAESENFVISVTLGDDIVGRLSIESFKELQIKAIEKRDKDKRSDRQILRKRVWRDVFKCPALCCCTGCQGKANEDRYKLTNGADGNEEATVLINGHQEEQDKKKTECPVNVRVKTPNGSEANVIDSLGNRQMPQPLSSSRMLMYIPGIIWHIQASIERHSDTDITGNKTVPVRWVSVRRRTPDYFTKVVVSKCMLEDHKLRNVNEMLKLLLKEADVKKVVPAIQPAGAVGPSGDGNVDAIQVAANDG